MPYFPSHPCPVVRMLIVDDFYFLLHAFDRLGRYLFGESWTGQEFKSRSLPTPDEVAADRAPLEAHREELDGRLRRIDEALSRAILQADIDRLKGERAALILEQTEVRSRLFAMPSATDGYRLDWEDFSRRQRTEHILLDALQTGRINAQFAEGQIIDWSGLHRDREFKVYLALSQVKAPRLRSPIRRGAALIRRNAFDEWLKGILPIHPGAIASLSPEEQCRAWIVGLGNSGQKPKPKPELWEEAQGLFPGLSKKAFERLWAQHAPDSWRRKGRPQSPKK